MFVKCCRLLYETVVVTVSAREGADFDVRMHTQVRLRHGPALDHVQLSFQSFSTVRSQVSVVHTPHSWLDVKDTTPDSGKAPRPRSNIYKHTLREVLTEQQYEVCM